MSQEQVREERSKRRILIVEDEADIVRLLTFHLEKEGYLVDSREDGPGGLHAALGNPPDLLILDIMLPHMDGLSVCRRLREDPRTANLPILILSARQEELDRVLGLELGADDYVIKPFSIRELVARVRARLRHLDHGARETPAAPEALQEGEKVMRGGEITLYPERHEVFVAGSRRDLTPKEFLLLEILMSNTGRVLTREVLLEKVWDYPVEVDTRTVDVHVRYLRQKVERDPARPRYIETVRGIGYRFSAASPLEGGEC